MIHLITSSSARAPCCPCALDFGIFIVSHERHETWDGRGRKRKRKKKKSLKLECPRPRRHERPCRGCRCVCVCGWGCGCRRRQDLVRAVCLLSTQLVSGCKGRSFNVQREDWSNIFPLSLPVLPLLLLINRIFIICPLQLKAPVAWNVTSITPGHGQQAKCESHRSIDHEWHEFCLPSSIFDQGTHITSVNCVTEAVTPAEAMKRPMSRLWWLNSLPERERERQGVRKGQRKGELAWLGHSMGETSATSECFALVAT